MDGQWQAGVGDRIRMEAEKAAIRHLTRLAVQFPDEWHKARDLALKWGLLPEYHTHLLKVYRRFRGRQS